jgi:hypothetical protein
MSLIFFSDQCVPAEISDILIRNGHQVTPLRDVLPIRSPDSDVIAKAQALRAMLLSLVNFLIENPEQDFYRGKLIIAEPHRIRIRQ